MFQENEEFTVRCESAELGTIVNPPPAGERIAIAGHCWLVEEVDWKRHLVYCTQVKGRVPAYFGDCAGDIDTHVLERMRRVLEENDVYPYLMGNARARLAQARHVAANAGIAGRNHGSIAVCAKNHIDDAEDIWEADEQGAIHCVGSAVAPADARTPDEARVANETETVPSMGQDPSSTWAETHGRSSHGWVATHFSHSNGCSKSNAQPNWESKGSIRPAPISCSFA